MLTDDQFQIGDNMDAEKTEVCPEDYSLKNLILYKMDRTIAVLGMVAIGVWALTTKEIPADAGKIVSGVITGLGVYLGVKGGSK